MADPDDNGGEVADFPALAGLGDLATLRPVLVVDTREQTPLPIRRLPTVRGTLQSGDYALAGAEHLFAVERKSVADLVACCMGSNRERFTRELHRLRGFRFARLLVIGDRGQIERGEYRSAIRPRAVLASLSAWEARYNVPVIYAATPEAGAVLVERWAYWMARELVRDAAALVRACTRPEDGQGATVPPEPASVS
jgi:ERCC4-type nuclease